uniref:Uncharacterized protein n=1 Tax=Oryza meridionalis TaxID=40149 RepID=A0A0E0F540_9ORYZ
MHAHGNGTITVATREAASDGRGEDEGALRSRFGTWDSWWSSVPRHPMTAHDRVAPGTRWFLGRSSVEQRGDDPSVHEQQKNMAVTMVYAKEPSSLGLRRCHRLEVPRQWSVPSTIASSDNNMTMAYKRSGRASMLQHGVAEAAPAAAARRCGSSTSSSSTAWLGGGVVVKQRGKEEGFCNY